jgi:hypothetical protein
MVDRKDIPNKNKKLGPEEQSDSENRFSLSSKAIKSLAATVAAITVLLTTAFTVDSRYVHAAALQEESLKQQRQITDLHFNILDDKIFELSMKKANNSKEWSATDQLMLDRYTQRLRDVQTLQSSQRKAANELMSK